MGALWSPSLPCLRWIESNIEKVRRAFFARGSSVFHGTLNPLSSKSIVEHCVLPCLLFGAESWILNAIGVRILCSKIRELCYALMLTLYHYYAPQNSTLCSISSPLCHIILLKNRHNNIIKKTNTSTEDEVSLYYLVTLVVLKHQ